VSGEREKRIGTLKGGFSWLEGKEKPLLVRGTAEKEGILKD